MKWPHRSMCLNIWFPVVGNVLEDRGTCKRWKSLREEVGCGQILFYHLAPFAIGCLLSNYAGMVSMPPPLCVPPPWLWSPPTVSQHTHSISYLVTARKKVCNAFCFLNFIMFITEHHVPANYFYLHYSFFLTVSALIVGSISLSGKTAPGIWCQIANGLPYLGFLSVHHFLKPCSACCTCEISIMEWLTH